MLSILIVVIAICLALFLAFSPRLSKSEQWQATVTPLASIMGSGFLVSAPLLAGVVGIYATFCMGILLVLSFFIGSTIRFNIEFFEPIEDEKGTAQDIALLSRVVLAGAYFVSITYYLQLLAAFSLKAAGIQNPMIANIITSALLCFIGVIGMWKGLSTLEKIEKYAVSLNLGTVGALIFALIFYNVKLAMTGDWTLPAVDSTIDLYDIRVLLGLLIVVQGFETSRYLGGKYSKQRRVSSMKAAQFLSSAIYLVFISLATVLFQSDLKADVTAIISMVTPISLVLPVVLSMAAIVSQFSASVADDSGAVGLVQDLTHRKISAKAIYFLILVITLFLTWETNVNEIIAYASRAFALFYALQCAVAFFVAKQLSQVKNKKLKCWGFFVLSAICFVVFFFGVPSGG